MHFGEHLTIDGYGGCPQRLDDRSLVTACLNDLCATLGMHKLTDPAIVYAPGNDRKDPGGWSGFLIIAESHISIHTFPKRRFMSADVYSCQNGIDVPQITQFFRHAFSLTDVETHLVLRGTRYPATNTV